MSSNCIKKDRLFAIKRSFIYKIFVFSTGYCKIINKKIFSKIWDAYFWLLFFSFLRRILSSKCFKKGRFFWRITFIYLQIFMFSTGFLKNNKRKNIFNFLRCRFLIPFSFFIFTSHSVFKLYQKDRFFYHKTFNYLQNFRVFDGFFTK